MPPPPHRHKSGVPGSFSDRTGEVAAEVLIADRA